MERKIQIAVNAEKPHDLCDFWAAALGFDVVSDPSFVQSMIDQGFATLDDTVNHNGALAWADGAACVDPAGVLPRMYFQLSPEPKAGKNRMHFDVQVGEENRQGEVDRILELGATKLWDGNQGPHSWVTMADPEGNEFCVS